jgi:hypothetical protein
MRERGQASVEWLATMAGVASLVAAAPTAPAPAQLASPAPTRQGDFCGSSYFNAPELWFTSACEGHDRCYGAHQGKAACDTAFLHDMLAICEHVGSSSGGVSSSSTRASCRAAARLYYKAVVVGGAAPPTATTWSAATIRRPQELAAGVRGSASATRTTRMRL